MNEGMTIVHSPGLPTWPALWFDPVKKHAQVSARLVTWRSYEWAIKAIRWSTILFGCWLSMRLWQRLPDLAGKWFPWGVGSLVIVIVLSILHPLIDLTLRNFLARQIFSRTSTFWLTPHAMAFRSPLYSAEQIIPRFWNRLPVVLRFDITKDHYAQHAMAGLKAKQRHDGTHLEMAQVLRSIVRVASPNQAIANQNQLNVMRSVPLTEVLSIDAERLATVLTAAASLTSVKIHDTGRTPVGGVDIDELQPFRSE